MSRSLLILPQQICQRFTFTEIQLATQNFDEKLVIGHGGFGKVYKCRLTIGSVVTEVAIKRLDSMSNQGATEFEAEVKLLSKLRHGNLVSLIGYCNEKKEMVLAYEFVPNGTLSDLLRNVNCDLSWLQRLKICIGAARALDYLHMGTATQQGIIHRDVKTSNILLDANFDAKISDFGLAKIGPINQTRTDVSTGVKGTFGYMDPCHFFSGKLTRKSDVYAFGVVLFEVLSGKQAVDSTLDEDQWSLAAWAQDQIKDGKLNKIIDPRLLGQISKKCMKEFAGLAVQCLHTQPKRRPMMAEVVVRLETILSHVRELANSVIDEQKLINKVRYFFTEKGNVMQPASAIGSEPELNAHHIHEYYGNLRIFTYAELVSATNNFEDHEHSSSSNGLIFKGWVDKSTYTPTKSGVGLAIYVGKKHVGGSKLYLKAADFNHLNLVKLLGYCLNENELYFVYELLPHESLDKLLFGEQGRTSLSWPALLKIALGAAQGLSFLHRGNYPAYSRFQTNHILVDKDFNARLMNYEVEKYDFTGTDSVGMVASYMPPEVHKYHVDKLQGLSSASGFGIKCEIYYFGVVLLEMLTGMEALDVNRPPGKQDFVKWAKGLLAEEEKFRKIMDPKLQHIFLQRVHSSGLSLFQTVFNGIKKNAHLLIKS